MNELFYEPENTWKNASAQREKDIFDFCEGYKSFLDASVTERKCVNRAEEIAKENGFVNIEEKTELLPGDKVYAVNRGKNIYLAVIGRKKVSLGTNIIAAHIDSPRLDLKPVPFFENDGFAYLKTHYYGGIKKYQWTTIPMALSGVVVTKNGTVNVDIGAEDDMCVTISDILPHLGTQQSKKTLSEAIEGEKLNILVGSKPEGDGEYSVKNGVLKILNEKYGIKEEDFISAEIEAYPKIKSTDVGIDRSMIGAYGQDDRVCAYTSLCAAIECKNPETTAVCALVDKEEIGSMGTTGIRSMFFENFFAELICRQENYSDILLRRCFSASKCLSADVNAAFDPMFESVYERRNSAYFNKGVVITKYTGSRGKSGSSDASAEFVGMVRKIFNENGVVWQTGELGKIDEGGGGTVAQYVANLNIDTLDCGVALLNMHAPFELSAKADVYMAYKGYSAFFNV